MESTSNQLSDLYDMKKLVNKTLDEMREYQLNHQKAMEGLTSEFGREIAKKDKMISDLRN